MDIITQSVVIRGTLDAAGAIILALCDHGTPDNPRTPTEDEKWNAIRRVRNELIALSEWQYSRHQQELKLIEYGAMAETTMTDVQLRDELIYIQSLRDLPGTAETPESVVFPEPPA